MIANMDDDCRAFYIASRLENVGRVRELKRILEAAGHVHTYDWTVHGSVQDAGLDAIREVARREALGVLSADVVIVLLPGGRGTHTELGIAIADAIRGQPKRIVLLSESSEIDFGTDGRTCALYHHPKVERVTSWDALLATLGVGGSGKGARP